METIMSKTTNLCIFLSMILSLGLYASPSASAQSTVYAGHYVKKSSGALSDLQASNCQALVCPTPSPTISPYNITSTSNGNLVIYQFTIPSNWGSSNLLLSAQVRYKGFLHDICQVSGARWSSASQVNPSTAYTINIPSSSYVTVKQGTSNISGVNVRLIKNEQYVTDDTPTTYNGAEFAIPTSNQNLSAAAIYKGWFYRSGNFSASTPKTINLSVPVIVCNNPMRG
jgi:hypothetical protein